MAKRQYKKVDLSKLSPEEKKKHKKHLLEVQAYTRARREWQRKIKAGEIAETMSLSEFRAARHGDKIMTAAPKATVEKASTELHEIANEENFVIDQLQKLIDGIKGSHKRTAELATFLRKLGGK